MSPDDLARLMALVAVALVAVGALLLLLRLGGRTTPGSDALREGYPPEQFADRELLRLPALAELAAAQGRLLAMRRALSPQSEEAVWLDALLRELRPLMDTAYRVAAATRAYGPPAGLEALSAEVVGIEREVAAQITRRMLGRVSAADDELLSARLAALRLCASQLAAA